MTIIKSETLFAAAPMQILSVTLTNFKSHSDRYFEFQPGTNAICGENGAGKTSILEAIAWTLFNYRGPYRTDDLIRNGAATAQVRVVFVSNRDHRTYEVLRCTRAGYTLFDPQLGQKLNYTRIEEEVQPWLREHLGVPPGTDLADLFANTIGVPQGLFTADFLKPERERKKTFDAILKVEEYRQAFDKLLPLNRYAEGMVKAMEDAIAQYDLDLQELAPLQDKHQAQQQEIDQVTRDLKQAQEQVTNLKQVQERLTAQANQLQQLEQRRGQLNSQLEAQQGSQQRLQANLHEAEQAAKVCTANRDAFQAYNQAEDTLQALRKQQQQELKLRAELRQQEKQLSDRNQQAIALRTQLEQLTLAQAEIQQLEPLAQQQTTLEQQQQDLAQQLQLCAVVRHNLTAQTQQLAQAKTQLEQLQTEIQHLQKLDQVVQQISLLEQQEQRYQQQLSRIEAATQFETDLRQLLQHTQMGSDRYLAQVQQATTTLHELQQAVPLWAEPLEIALKTLQSGADWQHEVMTALQGILADLTEQTSVPKLEQQLRSVRTELQAARRHQIEAANLERRQREQADLEQRVRDLTQSIQSLTTDLAAEADLTRQQAELAEALQALNDPRGQIRLRQQSLQRQAQLKAQLQEIDDAMAEVTQAIAGLETTLEAFDDLQDVIQTQEALKQSYQAAYEEYLKYRELANTRRKRRDELEELTQQIGQLDQEMAEVQAECDRKTQEFDAHQYQEIQTTYREAERQCDRLSARLPDLNRLLTELQQSLNRLEALQTQRQQAETDLKQKRQIQRFIKFAREAYKKAGPRITERYVQSISREADRLFRELLNRPNVRLEWTKDYDILVQEGAHTRRFVNLSGGEQMCAALAVRLALLKVLADIDIAFFDEPTTNMDRPRREHLADAIANLKSFQQLFVISHDDTFEKVTENVIMVNREG